jgi:hypothetical protein
VIELDLLSLHNYVLQMKAPVLSHEKLKIAKDFVDKLIHTKLDDALPRVQPNHEMRVIADLPVLGGPAKMDLVIREVNKFLWLQALALADPGKEDLRICIFGTPGVGKSASIPHLIRFILQQNRSVVYLMRDKERLSWYYEFIPTNDENMPYNCSVYPESTHPYDIACLKDKQACYIIDSGDTVDDCIPRNELQARVIIVASADDKHWGGSNFFKENYNGGYQAKGGTLLCYSLWSLGELLSAREYLNKFVRARIDKPILRIWRSPTASVRIRSCFWFKKEKTDIWHFKVIQYG